MSEQFVPIKGSFVGSPQNDICWILYVQSTQISKLLVYKNIHVNVHSQLPLEYNCKPWEHLSFVQLFVEMKFNEWNLSCHTCNYLTYARVQVLFFLNLQTILKSIQGKIDSVKNLLVLKGVQTLARLFSKLHCSL